MNQLFLIAGPCAIEDKGLAHEIAVEVKNICESLKLDYIFKGSYKKANRSRIDSFTGIDKKEALSILQSVKEKHNVPVITDVHESHECEEVAKYVDILQIPAFLCRQTELLIAAGNTGKQLNIKKGQFMAPEAMNYAIQKVQSTGNDKVWLTERGTTFGYESLIVDMTSIPRMKNFGATVIMDCTHSVQQPNQESGITGGNAEFIRTICLSAIAAGADGLFIETHPNPQQAQSDAKSMLPLDQLQPILKEAVAIRSVISLEQ